MVRSAFEMAYSEVELPAAPDGGEPVGEQPGVELGAGTLDRAVGHEPAGARRARRGRRAAG